MAEWSLLLFEHRLFSVALPTRAHFGTAIERTHQFHSYIHNVARDVVDMIADKEASCEYRALLSLVY